MHQNPVPILLLAFVAAAVVVAFRRRYADVARLVRSSLALTDRRRHRRRRADHRRHGRVPPALDLGRRAATDASRSRVAVALRWIAERRADVGPDRRHRRRGRRRRDLAGAGVARAATADPPPADARRRGRPACPPAASAPSRPVATPVLLRAGVGGRVRGHEGRRARRSIRPGVGVRVPESNDNRLTFGRSRADRHGPVRGLYVVVTDAHDRRLAQPARATVRSRTSAPSTRPSTRACSAGSTSSSDRHGRRSSPSSPELVGGCTRSRSSRCRGSRTTGPTEPGRYPAGMRDRLTATVERIPPLVRTIDRGRRLRRRRRRGSRSPRGTTCRAAGSTSGR